MLTVKINNSDKNCWYYNLQFKNNKQKTFEVIPNSDFSKFVIVKGDCLGKEIMPEHVKDIPAKDILELFKIIR